MNMNDKEVLVCLVGASGSGKTTIANILQSKYGLKVVESYTTRPMRDEFETGHIFVTKEFFNGIRDQLVAYMKYLGFEYGVTPDLLDEYSIYIVDPEGLKELKEKYDRKRIVSVMINAPETVRTTRLFLRESDGKKDVPLDRRMARVISRLRKDRELFVGSCGCDMIVNNVTSDDLAEAVEKIAALFVD